MPSSHHVKKFTMATAISSLAVLGLAACSDETNSAEEVNITPITENTDDFETPGGEAVEEAADGVETETSFVNNSVPGIEVKMTYIAVGDDVTKQITENVIDYELSGLETKAGAQEAIEPMVERSERIEGYDYTVEYGDTSLVEEVTVDFETVDWDKMSEIPGYEAPAEVSSGDAALSLQDVREMHEDLQYEEVQ